MVRELLLILALGPTRVAWADAPAPIVVRVSLDDAARVPRSAAIIGGACSFCTGLMSRRVVTQGAAYTFVGRLQKQETVADSVACPYTLEGQPDTCVLATEFVENLADQIAEGAQVAVEGRILDLDGLRYVVLTAFGPSTG